MIIPDKFQHILRVLNTNIDGHQKIMFGLTAIKVLLHYWILLIEPPKVCVIIRLTFRVWEDVMPTLSWRKPISIWPNVLESSLMRRYGDYMVNAISRWYIKIIELLFHGMSLTSVFIAPVNWKWWYVKDGSIQMVLTNRGKSYRCGLTKLKLSLKNWPLSLKIYLAVVLLPSIVV